MKHPAFYSVSTGAGTMCVFDKDGMFVTRAETRRVSNLLNELLRKNEAKPSTRADKVVWKMRGASR